MSLTSARSTLSDAHELFMHRWRHVSEQWDDEARRAFEEEVINQAEMAVKSALSGMSMMDERLSQAKQECQ